MDAEVLASLVDRDGLLLQEQVEVLRTTFGARPKAAFVAHAWPVLRDVWLAGAPERRARVARRLRAAGLGHTDIALTTAEGQAAYLASCRNSATLRAVVLDEFVAAGEATPTVKAPKAAAAWGMFESALASALGGLDEDQYVVVSVKGTGVEHVDGVPGTPYYVQFAAQGAHGFRAESVSNSYLVGTERLDDAQERTLLGLGWDRPTHDSSTDVRSDPDGSSNYFRDWPTPVPFDEIARLTARTLREVHGVPHPGYLSYAAFGTGGAEIHLPTLGIKRETPAPPPVVDESGAASALTHPQSPEELRDAVAATLKSLLELDEITVDDDGDIPIQWSSAVIYVCALPDVPVVRCFSFVLTDVRPSTALQEAVNELNRVRPLIRAYWLDDAVVVSADIWASPYVSAHVVNVLREMAETADEVDDDFQARFSGKMGPRHHTFGGYL